MNRYEYSYANAKYTVLILTTDIFVSFSYSDCYSPKLESFKCAKANVILKCFL